MTNPFPMEFSAWRRLEINGGRVAPGPPLRLEVAPGAAGYADAQIDDYGGRPRRRYPWWPPVRLRLRARFSSPADRLRGTAGFGFWNAPFGDPTVPFPALPRAAWFFFGSPPNDLPLNPAGPGQGWFAATIDAGRPQALLMAPLAPFVLLGNRLPAFRRVVWPRVLARLGVRFSPLDTIDLTGWHRYELVWEPAGVSFAVDGRPVLRTRVSPRPPLGFVAWIDNQFLALTPTGGWRAGTLPIVTKQWLEIDDFHLESSLSSPSLEL